MITRRYRQPRGLNSEHTEYGFFVRLSGEDRDLMRQAASIAEGRLGGKPSNPMLLIEMMKVYVESVEQPQKPIEYDDEVFI